MDVCPQTIRPITQRCLGVVCVLVFASCAFSGCATNRVAAAKLPAEWEAELPENAQTLALAKVASPTIQSDMIGRGDVLEINISAGLSTEDDLSRVVRVSDAGTVFLSDLGHVPLEGMELETAEATIGSLCMEHGLYRSPQVTVTMKQPKMNSITVIGAVMEPKTYRLRSGSSDLLSALVAAGGLAENAGIMVEIRHQGFHNQASVPLMSSSSEGTADTCIVQAGYEEQLESNGARSLRINLIAATKNGQGGQHLPDGTIVMVEPRDPEAISVFGLVSKPNEYEYPVGKELRLLDAIALAGGIGNPVANKVYIVRKKPDSEDTILIQASIRKAKNNRGMDNPRLAPGDVVSVEQTPLTAVFEGLRLIGFGVNGRAF
ncbi:MAG: polysaccharide biosynthesis/export family protein [Planctomycetaceae bacterium]